MDNSLEPILYLRHKWQEGTTNVRHYIAGIVVAASLIAPASAQTKGACDLAPGMTLPSREAVSMATSLSTSARNTMALYECVTSTASVMCYLNYTRTQPGSADYSLTPQTLAQVKLFDNFKEMHKAVDAYYCNGRNKAVKSVNLGQDDSLWMVIEFENGANDISQARILFPNESGGGQIEFRGPVVKLS